MKLKKKVITVPSEGAAPAQGGAYLSSRHRNPTEQVGSTKAPVDGFGLVVAILATICVGVLIYMLHTQVQVIDEHDQIAQIVR